MRKILLEKWSDIQMKGTNKPKEQLKVFKLTEVCLNQKRIKICEHFLLIETDISEQLNSCSFGLFVPFMWISLFFFSKSFPLFIPILCYSYFSISFFDWV